MNTDMATFNLIFGVLIIFAPACDGNTPTSTNTTTELPSTSDTSPQEETSISSTGSSTGFTADASESSTGVTGESTESSSVYTTEPTGSSSEFTSDSTESSSGVTEDYTGSSSVATSDTTVSSPGVTDDITGSSSMVTSETTVSSPGVTDDITGSSSVPTSDTTVSSPGVTDDITGSSSMVTSETTMSSPVVTDDITGSSSMATSDTTLSSPGVTDDITGSSSMVTSETTVSSPGVTDDITGSSSVPTSDTTVSSPGVTDDIIGSSSVPTSDTTETSPGVTVDPGHTASSSETSVSESEGSSTAIPSPSSSPTSPTTPTYEYETSQPDLSEAVYSLLILVQVEADLTDTTTVAKDILQQFNTSFQGMDQFKAIMVVKVGSDVAPLSERTPLELRLYFSAEELISVDKTAFREDVETRVNVSSTSPVSGIAFSVQPYTAQLSQLLSESDNVCAAEGELCPSVLLVCSSLDQLCVHQCERYECGEYGSCVVTHTSGDTRPSCQCEQDPENVYERMGERCEDETMRWQWVLGISAGVGGFLILTLLIALCVCCRRRPRPPYSHQFPDDDLYMHEMKSGLHTAHPQQQDTGRSNQGYMQDDNTYRYEGTPAGMSFLHNQRAQPLGGDREEKFKIQRPSLRS